jgi:hypothetical protein
MQPQFILRLSSPPVFFRVTGKALPWLIGASLLLGAIGLWRMALRPGEQEELSRKFGRRIPFLRKSTS